MKKAEAFCRRVDAVNHWAGKIVAWAVVPMMVFIIIEVTLRYIFNNPTIWVWDVNVQLLALIAIMGSGYTLLHGGHVSMDVLAVRLSARRRAILDLIISLLFFFCIGVLVWKVGVSAWNSVQAREVYNTIFGPPLYPLRVVIVVGVALLLLQGIVKFIRDLSVVIYSRGASNS